MVGNPTHVKSGCVVNKLTVCEDVRRAVVRGLVPLEWPVSAGRPLRTLHELFVDFV